MASKTNGSFCVYFEYTIGTDKVPQIVYSGSEEQCRRHVAEYNRQTPELYRCKLHIGDSKSTCERIEQLKNKYGTT